MSNLLDRLAQNARAHLQDLLRRYGVTETPSTWQDYPGGDPGGDTGGDPVHADEPHAAPGPLPHSPELADAYRVLDLPFGTPLRQVETRWRSYLKRCHPDRFHNDPKRLSDAAELTRQLNAAHDRIEAAWRQAGGGGTD